jgi:hypothetical protein
MLVQYILYLRIILLRIRRCTHCIDASLQVQAGRQAGQAGQAKQAGGARKGPPKERQVAKDFFSSLLGRTLLPYGATKYFPFDSVVNRTD